AQWHFYTGAKVWLLWITHRKMRPQGGILFSKCALTFRCVDGIIIGNERKGGEADDTGYRASIEGVSPAFLF
ncbi:MAG: hypothetical protein KBG54_04110, partial [Oscillospiraceae bacterium]|nr:hypothetical protein [Oscillospiraceae bacterium]